MSTPTNSLRGYIDDSVFFDGYGIVIDTLLEQVPELTWPLSVRTYARMRHDPQIAAILKAYRFPIRRARWAIDSSGCRDEVAAQIADDLGLPILGVDETPKGARRRKFMFAEHLRVSLLDQVFGHMFFEQQWSTQDGRYRLEMVQERMPQTIAAFNLNDDGTLKSVEQNRKAHEQALPAITTADHRLVYYANEREGANYFGQALIRPAYGMWLIKTEMLRVHATSIKRFGMGIPQVNAPQGATVQQEAQAQQLAAGYKAGAFAGAGLPYGFSFDLKGMTGTVPDAVAFITYLDRQMTRATLTSLLDMATAERGARSLGETVMDLMVYAQQTVAQAHAETATAQLVVPLVDANWGEDEPAPRVVTGDVGADVELTAQDMNWLLEYGGLRPDQPARAWIRQRYGLPGEDPNYQPTAAPGTAPSPGSGE